MGNFNALVVVVFVVFGPWRHCLVHGEDDGRCPSFESGNGIDNKGSDGNYAEFAGGHSYEECYELCQNEIKNGDTEINGITFWNIHTDNHCHCKRNVVATNGDDKSNTCTFYDAVLCDPECENGGKCRRNGTCNCTSDWEGVNCTTPICNPECENGGTCDSAHTCQCTPEWEGDHCQKSFCNPTCENGGECLSNHTCKCTPEWQGVDCKTPKCTPECKNKAVCKEHNVCDCSTVKGKGWKGHRCEINIDECKTDNGGCDRRSTICHDTDGSFECRCRTAYKPDPNDKYKCLEKMFTVKVNVPKDWKEKKRQRELNLKVEL